MDNNFSFEILACSIKKINSKAGNAAKSAVNQLMTLRNWAIGYYIVEYEQDGKQMYTGTDHGNEFFETEEKMRLLFLDFANL